MKPGLRSSYPTTANKNIITKGNMFAFLELLPGQKKRKYNMFL
jgi:hypothetical protein